MRSAVLITVGSAIAAACLLAVVWTSTDWLEMGRPGDRDGTGEGPTGERTALVGDIRTVGYGEPLAGVTVEEAATGAVFAFPGGRRISAEAPDGWRLTGEFVVLDEIRGGVFLAPEAGGREVYVPFIDTGARREPGNSTQAIALYQQVAGQLEAAGSYGVLDAELPVVEVNAGQDAVFFCLDSSGQQGAGDRMSGALRFVGSLLLTVLSPGACDLSETGAVAEKLSLAEAVYADNR